MSDLIIVMIVAAIVFAAGGYVYKAKKSGAKCIGCPAGKSCGGGQGCDCCGNTKQ